MGDMRCPKCRIGDTSVVDSRSENGGPFVVRRRRRCDACQHRFTTYEIVDSAVDQTMVLTLEMFLKNGRIEHRIREKRLCPCGNEARYLVDGELEVRLCALCDLQLNDGRGTRAEG